MPVSLDMFADRLAFDIAKDLERIDGVMTKIVTDADNYKPFLSDPNGMFVKYGLHPATTSDVNNRVNRVFYAALTNHELIRFVTEHYSSFAPSKMNEYREFHMEGLAEGRLQNNLELDLLGADHILKSPEALTKTYRLLLHDLNKKKILQKEYTEDSINEFVDSLVEATILRKPIREMPVLEEWDRNYGVGGMEFGAEAVEVGPVVTVVTLAEGAVLVTIAGILAFNPDLNQTLVLSHSDKGAATLLATWSKLINFGAELMIHANTFEIR